MRGSAQGPRRPGRAGLHRPGRRLGLRRYQRLAGPSCAGARTARGVGRLTHEVYAIAEKVLAQRPGDFRSMRNRALAADLLGRLALRRHDYAAAAEYGARSELAGESYVQFNPSDLVPGIIGSAARIRCPTRCSSAARCSTRSRCCAPPWRSRRTPGCRPAWARSSIRLGRSRGAGGPGRAAGRCGEVVAGGDSHERRTVRVAGDTGQWRDYCR